jgi:putative transposase
LDGAIALKESSVPTDPAEALALFRYRVVAEATSPRLSAADRGRLVRALAGQLHELPDGSQRQYGRGTLDRWVRAYREQGLDGLRPLPRADLGTVRRHPELLAEAGRLRAELPTRSAAQIAQILLARHGVRVAERTVRQYLHRRGLHRAALATQPRAFGRFEAERPNELWVGDVLVGPFVPHPRTAASRRAYLFVLVDDYSRLLLHGRWLPDQDARAGQTVLRAAIQRRGLPERLYVDNGAPYANAALERTCAVLGVRLIHSRPYAPEGRGKLERLNRFVRERFVAEAEAQGIASFQDLNDRFLAWAEHVCNTRQHAETGQAPVERFLSAGGRGRRLPGAVVPGRGVSARPARGDRAAVGARLRPRRGAGGRGAARGQRTRDRPGQLHRLAHRRRGGGGAGGDDQARAPLRGARWRRRRRRRRGAPVARQRVSERPARREQHQAEHGAGQVEVVADAVGRAPAHRREQFERLGDVRQGHHDQTPGADQLQETPDRPRLEERDRRPAGREGGRSQRGSRATSARASSAQSPPRSG